MPDQRFPQSGREDAFGDLVTKGVQNSLDLPAFHSFSEERYRFIENGTRIQDPDADSTRFDDRDKDFLLSPEAGDTLQLKTAERPRYIVGSDVAVESSAGLGASASKTGVNRAANRPVYPDDVVLMIARTPDASTATEVDVFIGTDQDW